MTTAINELHGTLKYPQFTEAPKLAKRQRSDTFGSADTTKPLRKKITPSQVPLPAEKMTKREQLSQLFFQEIMTKTGKEKSIVLKWPAPTQKEGMKYIMEITDIAINQRNLLFDEKGGVKRPALEHIWYNCVTMKPTIEKII